MKCRFRTGGPGPHYYRLPERLESLERRCGLTATPGAEQALAGRDPELLGRLREVKQILWRQGGVYRHPKRGSFEVRYRERSEEGTVHRSIYLGMDEELSELVRQVIENWKCEYFESPEGRWEAFWQALVTAIEMAPFGVRERRRVRRYARQLIEDRMFPAVLMLQSAIHALPPSRSRYSAQGGRWGSLESKLPRVFYRYDPETAETVIVRYDGENRAHEERIPLKDRPVAVEELRRWKRAIRRKSRSHGRHRSPRATRRFRGLAGPPSGPSPEPAIGTDGPRRKPNVIRPASLGGPRARWSKACGVAIRGRGSEASRPARITAGPAGRPAATDNPVTSDADAA